MSMHKIPLTPIEEAGLRAHGLDIGKPSQLSDAFRQGVRYARAHLPSQGGEAVEVVCITQGGCNVTWTATKELTPAGTALMSVRQHQRILAAATHPAEQVAGSVARDAERYRLYRLGFEDPEKFDAEIDAALSAKP